MNEIIVYQCEVCGKESRKKKILETHEIECKLEQARDRARRINEARWNEELRSKINAENIIDVINEYMKLAFGFTYPELEIKNFNFGMVRNSHGAPIGQKTNWDPKKNPDMPESLPGWSGRLVGKYPEKRKERDSPSDVFRSNVFRGLHTGTGGGVRGRFEYRFYLFVEDFPQLYAQYAKQLLMKI